MKVKFLRNFSFNGQLFKKDEVAEFSEVVVGELKKRGVVTDQFRHAKTTKKEVRNES